MHVTVEQESFFVCIDKPVDLTTYACVRHVRKLVGKKIKVGHAGTLDPFATGLVIIAVGRQATKHLSKLLGSDKRYTVQGKLGETTDTYDSTGTVTKTCNYEHITKKKLEEALSTFLPTYKQIPPIFSALKTGGKPLYKLARQHQLPESKLEQLARAKARMVTLHELTMVDFDRPSFSLTTHVSSGTYIRSLVHAIGERLSSCATTTALRRTSVGPYTLNDATTLEQISSLDELRRYAIPISAFLEKLA